MGMVVRDLDDAPIARPGARRAARPVRRGRAGLRRPRRPPARDDRGARPHARRGAPARGPKRAARARTRRGQAADLPPTDRAADAASDVSAAVRSGVAEAVALSAAVEDRPVMREGLEDGERVVTAGVPFLDPGQAVRLEGDAARPDPRAAGR